MRVTTNQPQSASETSAFFTRLGQWEGARVAVERFEEVVNKTISTPQPVFYTRLYHLLVDYLLERLNMPMREGGSEWEWKPLYQFGQSVDPFYFTEGSIQELLERWPVIGYEARQIMVSVLSGFFHLRRTGFPSCYPAALVPVTELERWTRIFPPEWAWSSLRVLRHLGFSTMSSEHAYRVFVRFSDGQFEPELNPGTLRRWFSECWRAGALVPGVGDERSHPYQANFLTAVYSARASALGVVGPCNYIPDCQHCTLKDDCRWYNSPLSERPGSSEVLALARRGHTEHLRTDQLLQSLFDLEGDAAGQLRAALGGGSLRELASMSIKELDGPFGFQWLLPERLAVTFELCRRFNEERMTVGGTFQTPWDVFKHFRIRLRDLKQEQFIVVLLDNKKRYLNDLVITQGTLNTSPVHPREVFNAAIRERAASVVVVHNHPSGDPNPSREDIHVTQQLIKVGELVGIPVLDHVIIADDLYLSMLEQGLLKS